MRKKIKVADFLLAFFIPMIIGKGLLMYFGAEYSAHPGDGYGYGLAATIAFTAFMFIRFIVHFWGYEDEDRENE